MSDFTTVIEGITMQHVGELFLDQADPRIEVASCRYTYLHSLETLMFALVAGDSLATSFDLPKSDPAAESSGTRFVNVLRAQLPEGRIVRLDQEAAAKPDGLLEDAHSRSEIAVWLEHLGRAVDRDPQAWRDLFQRETALYLGNDASLRDDLPSQEYVFGKSYFPDGPLEISVPEAFVTFAAPVIARAAPKQAGSVHAKALETFARRNAVSQVVIWLWYASRVMSTALPLLRRNNLTHLTRSSIVKERVRADSEAPRLEREVLARRAWKVIIPRIGAKLMANGGQPHELLDRVLDFSTGARSQRLQAGWRDAVYEFTQGNHRQLELLRTQLESWVEAPARETVQISANLDLDLQTLRPSASLSIGKDLSLPAKHAQLERSYQVITRTPEPYLPFEERAMEIFKRLK